MHTHAAAYAVATTSAAGKNRPQLLGPNSDYLVTLLLHLHVWLLHDMWIQLHSN